MKRWLFPSAALAGSFCDTHWSLSVLISFIILLITSSYSDSGEEQAILTEIEVLKQLRHPNVVGLVDLFITKDEYYIIMDLASGGHLFERILEKGHYTEMNAAALVRQLLEALIYIHDEVGKYCLFLHISSYLTKLFFSVSLSFCSGVVHRDLKPENLLFANKSENSPLLITDFGLSKLLTADESVVITRYYMLLVVSMKTKECFHAVLPVELHFILPLK